MKRKSIAAVLMVTMAASVFAGCGSSSSDTTTASDTATTEASVTEGAGEDVDAAGTETGSTTYRVVTSSVYAPFCYLNENNELDGYDVDIMKAVDEYDDTISFTYEWCDWASMLPGLDAGRYDICVYEMGKNEEREAMYHFGELPYSNSAGAAVITTAEHEDWATFDDIAATEGATVGLVVGSSFAEYVETYLEGNPDAFQVNYYDTEIDAILEDVANGRVDAVINDGTVALEKAKTNGIDSLIVSGYVTDPSPVWALYPQSELGEELSAKVDAAVLALYEDGTLAEIATKWLGDDYVISTLADTEYFD